MRAPTEVAVVGKRFEAAVCFRLWGSHGDRVRWSGAFQS